MRIDGARPTARASIDVRRRVVWSRVERGSDVRDGQRDRTRGLRARAGRARARVRERRGRACGAARARARGRGPRARGAARPATRQIVARLRPGLVHRPAHRHRDGARPRARARRAVRRRLDAGGARGRRSGCPGADRRAPGELFALGEGGHRDGRAARPRRRTSRAGHALRRRRRRALPGAARGRRRARAGRRRRPSRSGCRRARRRRERRRTRAGLRAPARRGATARRDRDHCHCRSTRSTRSTRSSAAPIPRRGRARCSPGS